MGTQALKLATPHLILRLLQEEEVSDLKEFEKSNATHWAPWASTSLDQIEATYVERMRQWEKESKEGQAVRFFIFRKEDPPTLIGSCHFTQIFRGSFQACYVGYKIDHDYEGKGFMFEALQHALHYVFEDLHLHRVMANYMPSNVRSAKLLNRLGFKIEGYAKAYLFINHHWEDHVLTALTQEEWKHSLASVMPI